MGKPDDLKVEELQSKLEAKEIILNLLDGEDGDDQALFTKSKGKKWTKGNSSNSSQ